MWSLPEYPNCTMGLGPYLDQMGVTVGKQVLIVYRPNQVSEQTNATVCACITTIVRMLKDLTGKHKYAKQEWTATPVSELECLRMQQWHDSTAGPMHRVSTGWATNNTVDWYLPPGPIGCCQWYNRNVTNCYLKYTLLSTQVGGMVSPALAVPKSCQFSDGKCDVPGGPYVMWPPKTNRSGCDVMEEAIIAGVSLVHGSKHFWVCEDGGQFLRYSNTASTVLVCGKELRYAEDTSLTDPVYFQPSAPQSVPLNHSAFMSVYVAAY